MDDDVQSAIDDLKSQISDIANRAEDLQKQVTEALTMANDNKPQPAAEAPVTGEQFADLAKQVADIQEKLVVMGDVRGALDKLTIYLQAQLFPALASGNSGGPIAAPYFSP